MSDSSWCMHLRRPLSTLLSASLVLLMWSMGVCAPASSQRPPNIVLIVSDDQGWRDARCLGREEMVTPNLDRLAREGIRATSFYVTWPACTPSRGSLLTGRYPQRNGLYDMVRNDMVNYGHQFTSDEYAVSPEMTLGLDPREYTIGDVLHRSGYATGCVGKWDMGQARRYLPLQRGFDFFYGHGNNGIDYYTHERYGIPSMFRGNERTEEDKGEYATDIFRREAIQFIETNREKPFFLYLAFNAPHSASSFGDDTQEGQKKTGVGVQVPDKYLQFYPQLKPNQGITRYLAAVTCMDEAIGSVLDTLHRFELEQDTIVLFMSDNGGSGNGGNAPLRGAKSTMWEGGLRVPLIVRWPGKIRANTSTDEFLTSLEILPTLLAATRAKPIADVQLDGFDMLPVLQGTALSQRKEMFWERRSDRAVRLENWKWVDSEKGSGLFDLTNDLGEKKDLSAERPEIVAHIKSKFAAWKKEMLAAEPRGPFRDY